MRHPLPVASYQLPTPQAGCARLLNCHAEVAKTEKQQILLRRSPGIKPFGEVAGAGISVRGFDVMGGVLFGVIGTGLYSISSTGVATPVTGTIPGSQRVRITNNGADLVINLPDGSAYRSDGSTLSQIVDTTFTGWGGLDASYVDGYTVFRRPGTQQFFNTGLNALSFNGLDITSADANPDDLVGMIVNNRELILAGEKSVERWYNAANSPGSPFSRSPSGFYEIGCAAGDSLGTQDNSPFMLAADKTVRRLGAVWDRVSQHGVEAAIARMTMISDCFVLPYAIEGHLMLAFQFPNAGRTFVYDCTTRLWHERDSLGFGAWRANCIANAYGKQIVGDRLSGKFGIVDPDTFDEFGEPQRVSWTYQPVYAEGNRASHRRLELVVAAGQGLLSGQGSNPLATLKLSDDGGETFRTLPVRSLGVRGNYDARAVWWNLGMSRNRVYQVDVTDPIPLFVIDTHIEADGARF